MSVFKEIFDGNSAVIQTTTNLLYAGAGIGRSRLGILRSTDMTEKQSFGNWKETIVGGHPCDVFTPKLANDHGNLLIYLHGVHLGRMRHSEVYVEQFERFGLPVVAPVTQRSWWTDRICSEFDPAYSAERHLLERVLPFIHQAFPSVRMGLLGTSMGGQGALRIAYRHPQLFPVVAGVSPAIDYVEWMRNDPEDNLWQMYASLEEAEQDTAWMHIRGASRLRHQFFCCCPEDEAWWDNSNRLKQKLDELEVSYQCDLETKGGGHGFNYYNRMAPRVIEFLVQALGDSFQQR